MLYGFFYIYNCQRREIVTRKLLKIKENKFTMIFYFTGTGNCLYVVKKMETHPISISQIINH